jgi:hypothetical protein
MQCFCGALLNAPITTATQQLSGVHPLWSFQHTWDDHGATIHVTRQQLSVFRDPSLIQLQDDTKEWLGCFGGMVIATYDALCAIDRDGGFSRLLPVITCRADRMSFERTMGVLIANASNKPHAGVLGDIHRYGPWGIKYANRHKTKHLPITKVWVGR